MRNFIRMLLVAAVLFTVTQTAHALICDSSISNSYTSTGAVNHRDQCWIKVYNNTGASVARGTLMVPDGTADDGIKATTSTTLGHNPICMMDVVGGCASKAMCKCQIYGYTSALLLDVTSGPATVNLNLYQSTTNAGYAGGYEAGLAANPNIATAAVIGIAYDTAATSGTVEAYLRLK